MSNFLSQLEINPQVDNDDEDLEKEDLEREKEIKDFLENELDDDDLFDDESSFTSHQTPMQQLESPAESLFEYQDFPNQQVSQPSQPITNNGPLLTSRGSDFLRRASSKINNGQDQYENNDQQGHMDNLYDYRLMATNGEIVDSVQEYYAKPSGNNAYDQENEHFVQNKQNYENWKYNEYPSNEDADQLNFQSHARNYPVSVSSLNKGQEELTQVPRENSEFTPDSFHQHFSADKGNSISSSQERYQDGYTKHALSGGASKQEVIQRFLLSHDQQPGLYIDENQTDNSQTTDYQFRATGHDHHASMFPFENQREFVPIHQYPKNDRDHNDNELASNENTQLRILYDARGRKIEELQRSAEEKIEEQAKKMRILQHKLTILTGERDGLRVSNEQSMNFLREAENETEQFKQLLSKEKENNEKLKKNKSELIEKLGISESTIESLNQQLTALTQADSLFKMRSQHETILATLRQKHEEDMLHLKEKYDDTKKELNWKVEDVSRLQEELQLAKRMTDQAKIEAAETINKLTKSLEQSQRQCREILEEGSVNEIGEVKYQLKQLIKDKSQLEEKSREMMEELRDAKEQLRMYEAALDSSTKGPSSSTPFNAPNVEIKWPSQDYLNTPLSRFRNQPSVTESPVYSLRDELIKALANNRAKREELNNAKSKADVFEHQLEAANQDIKRLEIENGTLKATAKVTSEVQQTDKEKDSTRLTENEKAISDLQRELEICERKIVELESQCDEKDNENGRLKRDISELMQQFDKDKLEAIKNCEKTYLQFNEDSKEALEEKLKEMHSQETASLRAEMRNLNNELVDVKESYVAIAKENKNLEQQVRVECEREAEERLKELKSNMEELNKEALTKMEENLLNKNLSDLESERKKLKKEFEEEIQHRIETAIALAKVDWFAAYEEEKSATVERAVENAKTKWIADRNSSDSDIQDMFKQLKDEWETVKQDEFDQRLTAAVKLAKAEWQETSRGEATKAIDRAIEECNRKNQTLKQKEIEQAVVEARQNWERDAKRMKDRLKTTLEEMESLLKEIEKYKTEVSRLKEEVKKKESEFEEKMRDIIQQKEDEIAFVVARSKAECSKEKDVLRQQILQEESERIRLQLLASFAETKNNDLQEIIGKERNNTEGVEEKDHLTELKETISLIKESYQKRLQANKGDIELAVARAKDIWTKETKQKLEQSLKEQRSKLREEFEKEKSGALANANNKLRDEICKMEKKFEKEHQDRLQRELAQHKSEWKAELQGLQKEHVEALRCTLNEVKTRNEKDTDNLRRNFNDYIRKIKKENSEKLEKQKIDLDEYHSNLTKRTLELARKEWELETSFRSKHLADGKGKKPFSESHYTTHQSYSKVGQETGFETGHLESSDSGFTSPFAKTTKVCGTPQNKLQDGRKHLPELLEKSRDQSPPYEKLLEKLEADILHIKDEKNFPQHAFRLEEKSTQTEGNSQDNEAVLEDMRKYYLETVRRINADVLKHIAKTKENAAANLRKEVLKEKKALISKIRKNSIKKLKGNDSNKFADPKQTAVFAALKEVELEDASDAEKPSRDAKHKEQRKSQPPLNIELRNETSIAQLNTGNAIVAPALSPILSSPTSKRQSKVPVYRKPSTKRDSSPSNSMFSCESNGTFYTELPPSLNVTPMTESRSSRLSNRNTSEKGTC